MKPCQRCQSPDRIQGERFCKACKKIVNDEAYAAGKVREINVRTCTEARGRRCRSTWLIGGTADNIAERDDCD